MLGGDGVEFPISLLGRGLLRDQSLQEIVEMRAQVPVIGNMSDDRRRSEDASSRAQRASEVKMARRRESRAYL